MAQKITFGFLVIVLLAIVTSAQVESQKTAPVDANKFAVIINGAGGEPVYAKQFEEWTAQLSAVLSDRYGFDSKHVTDSD